jgi:hypothetical protein
LDADDLAQECILIIAFLSQRVTEPHHFFPDS